MEYVEVRDKVLFAMRYLPPGFRFHPTEEEIVNNYLAGIQELIVMPEVDICEYEPAQLPTLFQQNSIVRSNEAEGWFLCKKERGKRRSTREGYWKKTAKTKNLKSRKTNQTIGTKDILTFYQKVQGSDVRTNWVMHEYDLPDGSIRTQFVVCHVRFKPDGRAVSNPSLMGILDDSEPEDCSFDENVIQVMMRDLMEGWRQPLIETPQAPCTRQLQGGVVRRASEVEITLSFKTRLLLFLLLPPSLLVFFYFCFFSGLYPLNHQPRRIAITYPLNHRPRRIAITALVVLFAMAPLLLVMHSFFTMLLLFAIAIGVIVSLFSKDVDVLEELLRMEKICREIWKRTQKTINQWKRICKKFEEGKEHTDS